MFPTDDWELSPTLGWENPPLAPAQASFREFSAIGTLLD
jgi:hypothetical protein